ncbi:MAG: endonuclease MutS2 [Clostridiales bacterium]|nr:endonuclease MutS2 [Clostridiales bacterium]
MKVFKDLEFDLILNNISALAASPVVAEAIQNTVPTTDLNDAKKLLTQTGNAVNVLASHRPSLAFDDIGVLLSKAKVGGVLTPKELLSVTEHIRALRSLKNSVESTEGCDSLKDITAYARVCDELEYAIDSAIENETDIKDNASEKLYGIRRAIIRANARLREKLDSFTRQNNISKYLQDNIVTVRGGRYVLPVRNDCRGNVKGLVHDISSTGATVFIEPFAVVEANNEIITLKTEESNEIERILAELSEKVVKNAHELAVAQEVLTECGIIFAKAEYAKQTNAYCPNINDVGNINIIGARHPLIDSVTVVPVDISLGDKRLLLISGPNTGGKTVALKTVGLFSLMAACGIFVLANEGSAVSIFDKIYCDIGDSQSISQSLSTFSAHVTNLSRIMSEMDERSLVLLDEVGDGTDPDEGAALAIAVIKKILRTRSTSVITTHFNSVKEFALGSNSIANACMQFDNVNFRPTYKILNGVSGSSYALEIAERLGLEKDIVDDAKAALSTEKVAFDRILREAENLRNQAEKERSDSEALRIQARIDADKSRQIKYEYEQKLKEVNEKSRAMIKHLADEYSDRAEAVIEEIKKCLKTADEAVLFKARKIAKQIYNGVPSEQVKPEVSERPPQPSELTVGKSVFVTGLNKHGIIASPPRSNKVLVSIGSVKTEIPISSLLLVVEQTEKQSQNKSSRDSRDPENKEIMLLGKTVDEATSEIELILSDIPPRSVLRIVHGKGTGALGKGIQAYLKHHKRIKSFRYGRYGEGDTGVTIAEIK